MTVRALRKSVFKLKEHCELRDPLIEEWLPVHEDERAARALRDQIGSENGLADAGRGDKYTRVMFEERACGLFLERCQPTVELNVQPLSRRAGILDAEGDA